MRGVERQRAKSWRGKDDSWGAAPSRIAARHPIEPSPPFWRPVWRWSLLHWSPKRHWWIFDFYFIRFVILFSFLSSIYLNIFLILIGRCVSLEWPTNFRSQEEVKKMERLHGLCLTHVLESSLIEDVQDDFSKALCIFNQSATHAQGDRRAKFISTTVQGLWFVQLLSYTAKSFS